MVKILKNNPDSIKRLNVILKKIRENLENIKKISYKKLEDDYKYLVEQNNFLSNNFESIKTIHGVIQSSTGYKYYLNNIIYSFQGLFTEKISDIFLKDNRNANVGMKLYAKSLQSQPLWFTLIAPKFLNNFSTMLYSTKGIRDSVDFALKTHPDHGLSYFKLLLAKILPTFVFGAACIPDAISSINDNIKDYKERKNLYDIFSTYYNSLKNIIIYSKLLNKEILSLYKNNNIIEKILPEINIFDKIIKQLNFNNILNNCFNNRWTNSTIDKTKNIVIPYFLIKDYFSNGLNKKMHTMFRQDLQKLNYFHSKVSIDS